MSNRWDAEPRDAAAGAAESSTRGGATRDGGAKGVEDAVQAEAERVAAFADQLERLARRVRETKDPAALAALQDENLAAFETMMSDVGANALTAMRRTAADLRAALDEADGAARSAAAKADVAATAAATAEGGAGQAPDQDPAEMRAFETTIEVLAETRDSAMRALLSGAAERFADLEAAARAARGAEPDWEPFEGEPGEAGGPTDGRA